MNPTALDRYGLTHQLDMTLIAERRARRRDRQPVKRMRRTDPGGA